MGEAFDVEIRKVIVYFSGGRVFVETVASIESVDSFREFLNGF